MPCPKSASEWLAKVGASSEGWTGKGCASRVTWLRGGFSSQRVLRLIASFFQPLLAGGCLQFSAIWTPPTWQLASKCKSSEDNREGLKARKKSLSYVIQSQKYHTITFPLFYWLEPRDQAQPRLKGTRIHKGRNTRRQGWQGAISETAYYRDHLFFLGPRVLGRTSMIQVWGM